MGNVSGRLRPPDTELSALHIFLDFVLKMAHEVGSTAQLWFVNGLRGYYRETQTFTQAPRF